MWNIVTGLHVDTHAERELEMPDACRLQSRCESLIGDAVGHAHRIRRVVVRRAVVLGREWAYIKLVLEARAELPQSSRAETRKELAERFWRWRVQRVLRVDAQVARQGHRVLSKRVVLQGPRTVGGGAQCAQSQECKI